MSCTSFIVFSLSLASTEKKCTLSDENVDFMISRVLAQAHLQIDWKNSSAKSIAANKYTVKIFSHRPDRPYRNSASEYPSENISCTKILYSEMLHFYMCSYLLVYYRKLTCKFGKIVNIFNLCIFF